MNDIARPEPPLGEAASEADTPKLKVTSWRESQGVVTRAATVKLDKNGLERLHAQIPGFMRQNWEIPGLELYETGLLRNAIERTLAEYVATTPDSTEIDLVHIYDSLEQNFRTIVKFSNGLTASEYQQNPDERSHLLDEFKKKLYKAVGNLAQYGHIDTSSRY